MKPKIITICGSSRFVEEMSVCAWLLERNEGAIVMSLHLLPCWYATKEQIPDHLAEHEGVSDRLDELHLRKIDLSHEIFVVNKGYYIGDSTTNEIKYAQSKNLPIRWYTDDDIGHAVETMLNEAVLDCELGEDRKS